MYIFDIIRKKYVVLTPEEWVRQHVVHYLIYTRSFRQSYINVEKMFKINNIVKRYDVVVYNPDGSIYLLVECKKPDIKLSQTVFDQIARYNLQLNAKYLMVTNGLQHIYCRLDYENQKYNFLAEVPLNI
ncbi:MAG TPA: type I restriction enzyme HsdR N-terminal domain-containing protein [Flavobacterium sp.]|nr:type I restriction enzyme HsdR N-terminal domain-containing protein [Flavobacterium sp.]